MEAIQEVTAHLQLRAVVGLELEVAAESTLCWLCFYEVHRALLTVRKLQSADK